MCVNSDRLTRSSLALFLLGSSFALGSPQAADLFHVLGTVTAIDAKHIEVKPARGPIVSVLLNQQVKFKNKKNPKSPTPPEVGDHVIIEATKEKQKVTATIVHYSPMNNSAVTR